MSAAAVDQKIVRFALPIFGSAANSPEANPNNGNLLSSSSVRMLYVLSCYRAAVPDTIHESRYS